MCLLAILWRVTDDAPLIVAANREEEYARGGTLPAVVEGPVKFVGGLDPRAGGTWFGVNQFGVVAAATNGRRGRTPPEPRSRGLLVRDLLGCQTATEAARLAAKELGANKYAACNLLCADADVVYVLHSAEWLQVLPLPTGIHVLTKGNVNSTADPRVVRAKSWLEGKRLQTSGMWLDLCQSMCGDANPEGGGAICLHGEKGGTVSSTLLALRRPLHASTLLHAQGPPDRTPYVDHSRLLRFTS
jgi:uncharacterized protein with NRDE domain